MDPLPISEGNNTDFASANRGMMHACGHDAYVAMLLCNASLLNDIRDLFGGTILLIFQPGEARY